MTTINLQQKFLSMQLIVALILSLVAGQDESVLTTTSGQRISGKLESVSESAVQIETADGVESFSSDNIARISFPDRMMQDEMASKIQITLVDESVLNANSFTKHSAKSRILMPDGIPLDLDNRNLESVLLQPFSDSQLQSQWQSIQNSNLDSGDAIVIKRQGKLESLEGIVGDVTPESVEFKLDDRSAKIDRAKIYGIVFYHAQGREIPTANCQVLLTNGSAIGARMIEMSDGVSLDVNTPAGSQFSFPLETVSRLDFSVGRAVFLGNLNPINRDWTPLIASPAIMDRLKKVRLPRANRSYDNRPLALMIYPQAGDVTRTPKIRQFENGYAMMGGAKVVFSLDRRFERLTGLVGFSPRASAGGDVVLKIRCDGQIAFQHHMQRSDNNNPVKLDVSIKDVQRLVFEVEYHDGRAIGDTIHLCDLKVSR